jgi:uncharacterized membrane protein YdfJ with MMPL/SSD domain
MPLPTQIRRVSRQGALHRRAVTRDMIRHEDTLMNQRFTWFVTIQGLLLAATGFTWKDGPPALVVLFSSLGLATAVSAFFSYRLTNRAIDKLQTPHTNRTEHPEPILGYSLIDQPAQWGRLLPEVFLPWAFSAAWLLVAMVRVVCPPSLKHCLANEWLWRCAVCGVQ